MPADGAAKLRARGKAERRRGFVPPLSVSRPELLEDGSDRDFRRVIWGLLVVANRLQKYPEAFGRRVDISSAMYTTLSAIAHLQSMPGVGIKVLADHLHLPAPHVTTTVNKLVDAGMLSKRRNPDDGRGVLVSLTPAGEAALERLAPFQRQVNDALFDRLSRGEFKAFAAFVDLFVANTERALDKVAELERDERERRTARGADEITEKLAIKRNGKEWRDA